MALSNVMKSIVERIPRFILERHHCLRRLYAQNQKMFSGMHCLVTCVMGDCDNCGISKLAICPLESAASTTVTWKCFENEVIGHTPEGKPRKRIVEAYRETSPIVFFEYLKSKLPQFVRHNFIARWQDDHYKLSMKCLGEDMILSHIDYAENYTFEIQDQIQSMYWCSTQITILVHITYRKNDSGDVVKDLHFYISDDKKYDSLFV